VFAQLAGASVSYGHISSFVNKTVISRLTIFIMMIICSGDIPGVLEEEERQPGSSLGRVRL